MRIVGIDLAAKSENPSGFAVWRDGRIVCWSERAEDGRILSVCRGAEVVVFDAPLTSTDRPFRWRDEVFRKRAPVLPLTFPGMRELSERGRRLARRLRANVYETYPRAAEQFVKIRTCCGPIDEHARDAAVCCAVGLAVFRGEARTFGRAPKAALPERKITIDVKVLGAPLDER